jgi:PRTRC genetic system protein E
MSLFQELYELSLDTTVTLVISANASQQRMTVSVLPKPRADAREPALSTPLSLTATAAEFDAEFVETLRSYRVRRVSLAEQAAQTAELLDAATAASAKRGRGAVAKASATLASAKPAAGVGGPTARVAASSDDEDDDQVAHGGSPISGDSLPSEPAPLAHGDDTPEPQLFG